MTPEFATIFTRLRALLARHAGALAVTEDSPKRYCLTGGRHPKHQTPMPIAWVQVGKSYVSFHHMAVYARPDLLKGVSQKLRARMQGKSCFNFTAVDETLFAELEELTGYLHRMLDNVPLVKAFSREQARGDT